MDKNRITRSALSPLRLHNDPLSFYELFPLFCLLGVHPKIDQTIIRTVGGATIFGLFRCQRSALSAPLGELCFHLWQTTDAGRALHWYRATN